MEQSWCFRGVRFSFWGEQRPWSPADLVERYRLCDPSAECAAKLLLFFDMAMGWSGLRAVLVRIACMCPNDWAKQEKTQGVTEATLVTIAEYDIFL